MKPITCKYLPTTKQVTIGVGEIFKWGLAAITAAPTGGTSLVLVSVAP